MSIIFIEQMARLAAQHGFPARTLLYPLEPYGRGTGQVESLHGYAKRLAQAHHLRLNDLHRKYLCWVAVGRLNRVGNVFRPGHDGPSLVASDMDSDGRFSAALEKATGIIFMDELSFRCFGETFGKRVLHRYHRWCPLCMKEKSYARLVWGLISVTACAVHECRLEDRCPTCGKPPSGGWTARCCSRNFAETLPKPADAQAVSVAKAAEDILANRAAIRFDPTLVADRVRALADSHGLNPLRVLEEAGCRPCSALLAGTGKFNVSMAVAVAAHFKISLRQLLCGERGTSPARRATPSSERREKVRSELRFMTGQRSLTSASKILRKSLLYLRQELPAECKDFERAWRLAADGKLQRIAERVAAHSDPADGLGSVAQSVGLSLGTLTRRWPAECRGIVERHKAYREEVRRRDALALAQAMEAHSDPSESLPALAKRLGIKLSRMQTHHREHCMRIAAAHRRWLNAK